MNISIVIISHKDSPLLEEAIASARAQDFTGEFEVIIQHDQNKSMPENTNEAVRRAKGEYIKWLHYDDLLLPGSLTHLWGARGADVIIGDVIIFGEDWGISHHKNRVPESMEDFLSRNPINQAGCMYKRSVLLKEPLDETLWTAEEYELNLRLFAHGYKFTHVDMAVAKYRVHEEMKSGSAYFYVDKASKEKRDAVKEEIKNKFR